MTVNSMKVSWAERAGSGSGSEDRVFTSDNAVVLLDGARSVLAQERTGGWYADTLGRRLIDCLASCPEDSLSEILEASLVWMAKEYSLSPGESPSSTVSMLRWDDVRIDALVLGDSPVHRQNRSGEVEALRDDRLASVAPFQDELCRRYLRHGQGYDARHLQLIGELQRVERRHRNRPGGYWIAEADPYAAQQAMQRSWLRSDTSALLLTSDGVSCGPDDYQTPFSWTSAFALAKAAGPEALVQLVHDVEATDPQARKWPRHKCHDDKAVAFVICS